MDDPLERAVESAEHEKLINRIKELEAENKRLEGEMLKQRDWKDKFAQGYKIGAKEVIDALNKLITELEAVLDQLGAKECDCWRCMEERGQFRTNMILCPICGNKRCPKASDHRLECTHSNEPGQPGSVYK